MSFMFEEAGRALISATRSMLTETEGDGEEALTGSFFLA